MGLRVLSILTLLWFLGLYIADYVFPIDHSMDENYSLLTKIMKHCKAFEGCLRVLLLLLLNVHIFNNIKKMRKYPEALPYISLGMLGWWIFGYGINLIYGKKIPIHNYQPYDHQSYNIFLKTVDYFSRFLVLVSIILMAKISHMVLKSRKELHDRGEWTPSEKKVLLVSLGVYICYLLPIIFGYYNDEFYFTSLQGISIIDVFTKIIIDVLSYDIVYKFKDYYAVPQLIALYIWKPEHRAPLLSFLSGLWIASVLEMVYTSFCQ
ncbi:hypothetical protein L2E82_11899 [Cichorium intybus]|uniref:Uncharacterized protein n=1 Tax=Cichorium intybus TaxID=13427 RepID=A0ACB9GFT3_CICIN|nr:hypothetical protein L2E82_11899 [Cichorium intybus]